MTFSKLGTDTDSNQPVYLPKSARLQGLYIIGIQGTGKSGLIENLIMQDIKQQIGVCVLDPHGELIEHVLARLPGKTEEDKVILLDLANYQYPFGLNLFTCADLSNPFEVQKTVNQVMHVFEKLMGVSTDTPLILQYLRNCTYTLVANPGYTMAEIPLLLQDTQCRRTLLAQVTDPNVLLFWKRYERMAPSEQDIQAASILRRVEEFLQALTRNIVGQSNTTITLQDVMDTGKILLVKLNAQVDAISSLIGSLMIALLLNAAYNRPVNKRKQFHLYADEFQRFATEDFATLLEEARKFGIATTIAHQNRGQLNSANSKLETDLKDRSRSVGNMVVFRVNSKDADDLAGEFKITPQPAWEEELEEERLEIREPEQMETIEVSDGEEAIHTPVMEPIQFMLQKGVHPHPVVRNFINVYGQEIVKGAKLEEEAEREYRHALDAAIRDSPVGFGYDHWIFRYHPPTTYYRLILESLNHLLYQAMVVGTQGGNTDTIPISPEFIGYWIATLPRVPDEVKQHASLQQQYQHRYTEQQMQIQRTDLKRREWELQTKLATPQSAPRQNELQVARAKYTNAVENLRSGLRRAFVAQVEEIVRRCVIVQRGSWYYRPNFSLYSEPNYDITVFQLSSNMAIFNIDFQHLHLYDLGEYGGSKEFRSFDEAVAYHVQALRFLWFRVEPTLRDKNWWQHKQSVVKCTDHTKGNQKKLYYLIPETLDLWVPKPGIDRTWYTPAMLEQVVESALQAAIDPKRERLWHLYIYALSSASLGGEDYKEIAASKSEFYKEAEEKAYAAVQELTKLQSEIEWEVHQERASLQSELQVLAQLQTHKQQYDKFVEEFLTQLRMVMQVLAVEPILEGSGIRQPRKRQQILLHPEKTFPHPRKAITHPQRPYADIQNEIANQLSSLPNFTARTRIIVEGQTVEHTIKTLEPEKGLYGKALQERIVRIQTLNRRDGYTRARTDVEAEITLRQTSCSGFLVAQPQPQQPLPRHARQVPVQGKCKNCGAANSLGAKFCNQCGTKL
jgi:hypothetical protein